MSNKKLPAKKLKGFQDIFGSEMATRWQIMETVNRIGTCAGFSLMNTPVLEYIETLLGEGGETDKQVYRFEDNGGREIGMRFDLTMPLARFVAENQSKLTFPFKRIQMGPVFRAEKPQKGRYREFAQCDYDIIGVESIEADIEILGCILNTLEEIGFGNFTMSIGHRKVLSALITSQLGKVSESVEQQILIAIDKLEKVGADKVAGLVRDAFGEQDKSPSEAECLKLISMLTPESTDSETIIKLKNYAEKSVENTILLEAIKSIETTLELLNVSHRKKWGSVHLDLRIARGLAYYTGVVFETTIDALPKFGSISSGGRYDDLVDRFSSQKMPGVGGSLGLDRLLAGIAELKASEKTTEEARREGVFIAVASKAEYDYALSILSKLRARGIRSEASMKLNKLGKQFSMGDKKQYAFTAVIGSSEKENKVITLKNLETGEQLQELSFEKVLEAISS